MNVAKMIILSSLVATASLSAATLNQNVLSKIDIGADYRFSVDSLGYKMASGNEYKNNALLTNRLWLMLGYTEDKHLSFHSKIVYNKVFGQPVVSNVAFDGFDWFGSTTNTDNQVRIKEAYIDYKDDKLFGVNIGWDFGVGRRPTTYNKLLSFRDDEAASSPLGHIVSAEFDGGHLGFNLEKQIGIKGFRVKLAAGRGLSSIDSSISPTPVASSGENINMFAINVVTYANKNLHTELQVLRATNLVDITNAGFDNTGTFNAANYDPTLKTVGDISLASYMAMYNISSLKDTKVFASLALSQTDPSSGETMLGSADKKVGTSIWIGTQFPSLISSKGKWGVEYNHGSKYFRPFTYSEDTTVGSKLATRGDAYEIYFTEPLYKGLSCQLRTTYIDYKYSGSNGFFGSQTGTPMALSTLSSAMYASSDLADSVADSAYDFRAYLRYRF
ncbi:DUF3373 family protein [Sulfurimonas sp.]|uniref:DUF3373 family protein n=1 Tax=Sulfurimonas sp. TaxID=2022749 RepID=UPI003D138CE1